MCVFPLILLQYPSTVYCYISQALQFYCEKKNFINSSTLTSGPTEDCDLDLLCIVSSSGTWWKIPGRNLYGGIYIQYTWKQIII